MVRGVKNPLYFGFPARLRRARRAAGMNHVTLARAAGLGSKSTSHRLGAGEHVPTVGTCEKLARALGVSAAWLAYGPEPAPRPAAEPGEALLCAELPARLLAARQAAGLSRPALEERSRQILEERSRQTQEEKDKRAGVSASFVRAVESGRATPTLKTAEHLAACLGVAPGWLAFGIGPRELQPRGIRETGVPPVTNCP